MSDYEDVESRAVALITKRIKDAGFEVVVGYEGRETHFDLFTSGKLGRQLRIDVVFNDPYIRVYNPFSSNHNLEADRFDLSTVAGGDAASLKIYEYVGRALKGETA